MLFAHELLRLAEAAYIATFLFVLVAEFYPRRKVALRAALTSIALSLIAGSAWGWYAYQTRIAPKDDWHRVQPVVADAGEPQDDDAASGGGSSGSGGTMKRKGRAGSGDGAEGEDDDAGSGGSGRGRGKFKTSEDGVSAAIEDFVETLTPDSVKKRRAGLSALRTGAVVKDCVDCPDMVIVAAGNAVIGAPETDSFASSSDRPQRAVRFWPGFAISRAPISDVAFARFLSETGRTKAACDARVEPPVKGIANCLTAADADAFVNWLALRTGHAFRLPTAAEWEYASLKVGLTPFEVAANGPDALAWPPRIAIGNLIAEIVADCWYDYIPSPENVHLAVNTDPKACEARMIKGAHPSDGARFARPSSRRTWGLSARASSVGFRVVRQVK